MPRPTLRLLDGQVARSWSPFAETRPVGELRFGAWTLRERALRTLDATGGDHLGCEALEGFEEPGAGRIVARPEVAPAGGLWIWLSRAATTTATRIPTPEARTRVLLDEAEVGWFIPGGEPVPPQKELRGTGASIEAPGLLLDGPWSLVAANAGTLAADLESLGGGAPAPDLGPGVHLVGPPTLVFGEGVEVGPGVVLDTRDGPIRLEAGCTVEGPARLVGPLHLGPGCIVFGGHLASLSAGPVCKLRGEIADSVICGFTNKAHDGYLGHALLGHWVNLGAGTTNSDLKNNYSEVRVTTGAGSFDTEQVKVGVFLGDHVKTGIGTMLNTGTAIGAGTNVFGGVMPPKWLPPFSWSGPDGTVPFRFDRFDEVAGIVTARRDRPWPEGMRALFRRLHDATHGGSDRGA